MLNTILTNPPSNPSIHQMNSQMAALTHHPLGTPVQNPTDNFMWLDALAIRLIENEIEAGATLLPPITPINVIHKDNS